MENIPSATYDIGFLILFPCFSIYWLDILRICPEGKDIFSHFKTVFDKRKNRFGSITVSTDVLWSEYEEKNYPIKGLHLFTRLFIQ